MLRARQILIAISSVPIVVGAYLIGVATLGAGSPSSYPAAFAVGGGLLALLGLIFQALQTMSLSRATKAQVYQSLVASWVDLDKLLLADPRLRAYVYGDSELPEGPDEFVVSVLTVVDIAMNVADLTLQLEHHLPRSVREPWHAAARAVLSSPAALAYRDAQPEFYPQADNVVAQPQSQVGRAR